MKSWIPQSARNWLSLIGAVVALISFFMIVFLFTITAVFQQQATYIGLVIYILLPAVMVLGLLFIPLGMLRQIRKAGRGRAAGWPRIDLSDARHRRAFTLFAVGTALFLFISALGSYEAFRFTESNRFCGRLCHSVMEPEYTAYQDSPHARVHCVACHVGPGADWYVRSKLSGLVQVYKVLAETYPQPIPTPIENLRPAQEICLQCHWPKHFLPNNLKRNVHFLPDEQNTRWEVGLNLRIGPHGAGQGGIHWHIRRDVRVEYVAADEQRLEIPWVRYTDLSTGDSVEYLAEGIQGRPEDAEIHTMDCLDCHNRPSHRFMSPNDFVDEALLNGDISTSLPQVKTAAVKACRGDFTTQTEAEKGIARAMRAYYRKNHPQVLESRSDMLQQAIQAVQDAYSRNIFPEMKADWRDYPDHRGHLMFPGCFRCHDGKHRSEEGDSIGGDCSLCHDIVAQGVQEEGLTRVPVGQSLRFRHPVDIGGMWKDGCSGCHQGLIP